ncbi:MAG: nucleotidyl transferase AbiEii/AbiGii toxin family protein [Oligoflexus sp.]|nr:nucleotidyl transferase AbiEii/AbiGii toxin family protein [Oligoflexus sp.]
MKIPTHKIRSIAQELGIRTPDVQLLLAQERFLARLMSHPQGQHFIWKGGSLVLRAYRQLSPPRFTVDLDFLVRGITIENAAPYIKLAAETSLGDDFAFFDVTSSPMERDTLYGGDRYEISWTMTGKSGSQTLKIDICAGDFVEAVPRTLNDTTFFCDEEFSIQVYPPEYIFAEKLETLVKFGTGSTRTKDLIDLWSLRDNISSILNLRQHIQKCFERRMTPNSLAQITNVLTNTEFIQFHENQQKRRYKGLNIPTMAKIAQDVIEYVTA